MKIDIVGRNYTPSERLKGLIEKKVGKLDRFFDKPATSKVVCTSNKDRLKMELNVTCGKMFIRSEVESDNMYANLDNCLAKIERQISKYGEKFQAKRNIKPEAGEFEYFDEKPKFELPKITKRKTYELIPMTEEDALAQMDMVGNDFFVFLHAKLNKVCLLYKKADGTIGIIETK